MTLVARRLDHALHDRARRRLVRSGTARRRQLVIVEMLLAVAGCIAGYTLFIDWARHFEVRVCEQIILAMGVDRISAALGDSFIVFGPGFEPVTAQMTGSCSILSSVLALAALAVIVLRERSQVLLGFVVASVFVLAANQVRLLLSLLAGRYFAVDALVFFHDWIGAVINFAYTLIGLLIMIGMTMYDAQRAEQDHTGRHTADRPEAWARPGLGHRVPLADSEAPTVPKVPKVQVAAFLHRKILPRALSVRLARRRERTRVDYRVGHENAARRAAIVRELAAKGLGVHTATLLAVATHETDIGVLDALADAVAARQWEPVANADVIALRLWARAWLMRTPAVDVDLEKESGRLIAVTGAGGPAGVAVIQALRKAGDAVLALDANPDGVGLRLATHSAVLPRADQPGYAESLLSILAEHRPGALVCTVAEEYHALTPLVGHLDELGVRTWLPDPASAETCLDKVAFATALHAAGVPHPATAWTADTAGLVPGPWVVKPARGRGSRDVVLVDNPADLPHAFFSVPGAIVQTRLAGQEFTADALVARDGRMVACVPRWRDETRGGISVRGTTFASATVTDVVAATLRAVGHSGPANVQGFVDVTGAVTIVEVNPRFSGGLPLTLAAGADVVSAYVAGILDPAAEMPALEFQPGVRMARYFSEVFYTSSSLEMVGAAR
ncbi:ATP-grasp domain-containing protein [Actinoplanes sp. CA-015351]|uniref:ATP-grasp domain-containing protein n=1 Tax=Actinoplanes sp. CA-015351 TaxID=3239897 RepID=UPI003D9777D6